MRLSKEDERLRDESNSIRMQRLMLYEFVENHFKDYKLLEFMDDGYSGTNFNRPGVTNMLEQVRELLLDCIIVKDFSRFSRDYIELGSYIDQIFPFMGIRFISVNDHYDSDEYSRGMEGMNIYFKNLLYDFYSKDLSVKVKSSLAVRKEKGEYVSGNSPFGYKKSAGDKHMLFVEKNEAEIVRRIFDMAMEGMTSVQIARAFNEEGIKTPAEFRIEKGKWGRTPKGEKYLWSSAAICRILRNEVYVGDMIYGKTERREVGGKNYLKPKNEWGIFYNHHEPVIDRKVFEEIQKNHRKKKGKEKKERHPLTGRLVCGCCGRNLSMRTGLNPYFCCPNLYVGQKDMCVQKVNVMFLEQFVLYGIQQKIREIKDTASVRNKREELFSFLEMSDLTKEAVQEFVKKIIIFDEQHIEIFWNPQYSFDNSVT